MGRGSGEKKKTLKNFVTKMYFFTLIGRGRDKALFLQENSVGRPGLVMYNNPGNAYGGGTKWGKKERHRVSPQNVFREYREGSRSFCICWSLRRLATRG